MSNWGEVYRETLNRLKEAGIVEAEAETKVLLAHVCGCDFSQLCLRFFDECGEKRQVERLAEERLGGKPLAYVLREKYFFGRPFYVDERVLVPRYDTECVAARALALAAENGYRTALDLCCGSGIIGITLAAEGTFDRVLLADLSEDALDVARINCGRLLTEQCCRLLRGDLLDPVPGRVELIVSNPPYVSRAEYAALEPQVREYEPQAALVADREGYAFYERIVPESRRVLARGGALVLEIGDTQAKRVCSLLNENGFDKIEYGFDLAGRPRWVSGVWPAEA